MGEIIVRGIAHLPVGDKKIDTLDLAYIIAGTVNVFLLIAIGERLEPEVLTIIGDVTLAALLNSGQVVRELEER